MFFTWPIELPCGVTRPRGGEGVLPIMDYTGRLRRKGIPFEGGGI